MKEWKLQSEHWTTVFACSQILDIFVLVLPLIVRFYSNWNEVKIFSVATRNDPTSTLQSRNRAGEIEESEDVEEIAEYSAAANGEK